MEISDPEQPENDLEKHRGFVIEQITAGADRTTIYQKLVERGVTDADATQLVEKVYDQVIETAKNEQATASSLMPAIIGGCLAAVVGGSAWGATVILTDFEIGYMAIGIGILCGYAVVFFSKGKKGFQLQVVAVLASVLGIIIGKYSIFYYFLRKEVLTNYGEGVASNINPLSENVIRIFIENIQSMASAYDLLWIVLAVFSAWRIPQGIGAKLSRSNSPSLGKPI